MGAFATILHYSVALITLKQVGFSVYICNAVGFVCAFLFSFLGHTFMTFKSEITCGRFFRFFLVSFSSMLLSQIVLVLLEMYSSLDPQISLAIVVFYIVIQSYIFNRFWVFKLGS